MPLMPSFSRFALRDVMRRHLRIGPAEHRHHLALGAVGVSGDLGPCLAHAMAALLRLVDAGEHRVLLELHRPRLLVHRQHAALHHLAGEDFGADDAGRCAPPAGFPQIRGCTGTVTVVLPRLFSVAICTAILRTICRR